MTQEQKTEAVINALPERHEYNADVIEIAMDLARKLDAVSGLAKVDMHKRLGIQDYQSALRDIRAIVDAE